MKVVEVGVGNVLVLVTLDVWNTVSVTSTVTVEAATNVELDVLVITVVGEEMKTVAVLTTTEVG